MMFRRLKAAWEDWKQPKPHKVTGDMLEPAERVTWAVMSVYRRWTTFLALQILTVIWWTHPQWFPGGLPGWNYIWSDLAVIVEMMVGIAFLAQSMRDAMVIRRALKQLQDDSKLIRYIYEAMHPEGEGKLIVRHIEGDGNILELHPDAPLDR